MDEEPESRGLSRGRNSPDQNFPLEPVLPVEWYSRAQLEYLAEKIRSAQSIESLLLPIPKLAMNLSRPSLTQEDDKGAERREPTSMLESKANAPMNVFSHDDLSQPLRMASPPLVFEDQSNRVADQEMGVVTLVLENLVSIIVREEDDRSRPRSSAPLGFILADRVQPHQASQGSAEADRSKVEETAGASELPCGDSYVCGPRQSTGKTKQASPSSNEKAGDFAPHKAGLVNYGAPNELSDEPAQEPIPQRFLRRKQPLAREGTEENTVIQLHEPDGLEGHPQSLQPIIRRMFKQLVVIVSPGSEDSYRDFHHPSTFDNNFKLMKLEPAKLERIVAKLNIASSPCSPKASVAGEEPQNDATTKEPQNNVRTEEPPDNAVIEEPPKIRPPADEDEDTMRLKSELFDLIFGEDYEDMPVEEIIENARMKLLLEESAELKLVKEKRRLEEKRRELDHKLVKLQESRQRQKKRPEDPRTKSPLKRRFVGMQAPQPVVRTRVVAAAPKQATTVKDSANMHGMALSPGTLLRVVHANLDGHPAQAQSFTMLPQATRAGLSPGDLQMASPLRKTVNASSLPTLTADPHSDHLRKEASGVRGLPQNAALASANPTPTVVTVASNCNPTAHVFANHARFIRVDPNTRMSPGSSTFTTMHVGFPHGMARPGHSGNDVDPSFVNGQTRQVIQVSSHAFPVSKPSVITRTPNSRVVMVTPAQFSVLQSQVQQRRPIRIQNASMFGGGEPGPTTVVHQLSRYPDEFAAVPSGAATNLKPHMAAPVAFTEHRGPNVHYNEQTVIVNPSLDFQAVRTQSTMAPRFFTVRQPYITRPPGPSN